jgi:hypothetical protein
VQNPDMFGVVLHANIVSMILHENYVSQMQEWQEGIGRHCHLPFKTWHYFSIINTNLPSWYDGHYQVAAAYSI